MSNKEFNYVIGRYWKGKSGAISSYTLFSSDLYYSNKEDAERNKKHIEGLTGKKYKVFELVEQK